MNANTQLKKRKWKFPDAWVVYESKTGEIAAPVGIFSTREEARQYTKRLMARYILGSLKVFKVSPRRAYK